MSKKGKIEIDATTWSAVVVGLGLLAIFAMLSPLNDIAKKEREISGLRTQLDRTQKQLLEVTEQNEAYEDYLSSKNHIVTDKYNNGKDYVIKIGDSYYTVTKQQWEEAELGQSYDLYEVKNKN